MGSVVFRQQPELLMGVCSHPGNYLPKAPALDSAGCWVRPGLGLNEERVDFKIAATVLSIHAAPVLPNVYPPGSHSPPG